MKLIKELLEEVELIQEATEAGDKCQYIKGVFLQANVKNRNGRSYPMEVMEPEVNRYIKDVVDRNRAFGELGHPSGPQINLDRVSHMITTMWMDGANGFGKLKILPTPMGQLVKTMLESGVKLGVSSRGSGNVNDMDGKVSDFEIVTVDIVAQPSAPNAYPKAIYEGMMNMKHGHKLLGIAKDAQADKKVQRYLKEEVMRLIKDLKIK